MKRTAVVLLVTAIISGATSSAAVVDTTGIDLAAVGITYNFITPNKIEITTHFTVLDALPDSVKTTSSNLYFGVLTIEDSIITEPAPILCPEPPLDCTGDCMVRINGALEMGECATAIVWDPILQDTVAACGCKTGVSRTAVYNYTDEITIGFELDPDGILDELDESNNYVEVQILPPVPTTSDAGLMVFLLILLAAGALMLIRMKHSREKA